MFLDIRAFTALSEKVSPQALIEIINKVFGRLIGVIEQHRGFIDKFIGDAIMVIFGAPIYDSRHRERAVACAIDLRKARAGTRFLGCSNYPDCRNSRAALRDEFVVQVKRSEASLAL